MTDGATGGCGQQEVDLANLWQRLMALSRINGMGGAVTTGLATDMHHPGLIQGTSLVFQTDSHGQVLGRLA